MPGWRIARLAAVVAGCVAVDTVRESTAGSNRWNSAGLHAKVTHFPSADGRELANAVVAMEDLAAIAERLAAARTASIPGNLTACGREE